jgi:hypothetical protein
MVLPKIKMSDSISIIDIIKDIEEGLLSSEEIIKPPHLNPYVTFFKKTNSILLSEIH